MGDGAMIKGIERTKRKGDGGTYLVVADDSEDFQAALRFACTQAKANRAHVGILKVIEDQDFQHWGAVEEKVKKEMRDAAEKELWTVAKIANDLNGCIPSLYFAEGEAADAVMKTIENDERIIRLILGNSAGKGPGPLIAYCLGKGLERMQVPLVVVPAHMKEFS
jgi:hypothetical protein